MMMSKALLTVERYFSHNITTQNFFYSLSFSNSAPLYQCGLLIILASIIAILTKCYTSNCP